MAYKVKEQFKDMQLGNLLLPLGELNQKQILSLSDRNRSLYFIDDKPKKPKKYADYSKE